MCFIETYVYTADEMVIEDAYGEHGEKIHQPTTDPCSNTTNTEHMKSMVPDSFEYSQYEDLKTSEILAFDTAEAGRSDFNKEMCSPRSQEQLPGCDLPNGSPCHASELDFRNRPHDCDAYIPESAMDDMSPKDRIISEQSNDACSDLKENPVHVGFNSMQNDLSTAQDFTAGNVLMISGVKNKNSEMQIIIFSRVELYII